MQAIEFETDARGRIIEIPKEFEAFASKSYTFDGRTHRQCP